MSNELDFGDPTEDTEGIKNLRKAHKTQGQELADLKAQLAKFEVQERAKSVGELVKAKGVDPRYAQFYTGDDVSEDAVGKWLEENKDLFAPAQGEVADASQTNTVTTKPEADANTLAAQQVTSAFSPSVNSLPATFSGSATGKSLDELQQILDGTPDTAEGFRQLQEMGLFPKG